MADISNLLETVDDAERILVSSIRLAKEGNFSLGKVPMVFQLLKDFADLAQGLPAVWPELKDIDGEEAGQITTRCYSLVKSVIESVKK